MGKAAGGAAEMKKKKKGRPSLSDLRKRTLKQEEEQEDQQQQQTLTTSNPFSTPNSNNFNRRSTRRNPNPDDVSPATDWIDGDGDDDDERKEKKVKLVVRLPASNDVNYHQPGSSANSLSLNSASYGSDPNADGENNEFSVKKLKINAVADRSADVDPDQEGDEKVSKAMDIIPGSLLESGPTTPLPDKKLLVFILDRLQKKDTYGVFSEAVDPNELPDYHEIIEHPMDFGTVRNKLDEGRYSSLEEFEGDVLLICSNAMQYNAPDTVYFRQARSIQDLAKRDFENLKQVSDDGEPRPKVVRRGRPPGKNLKKPLGRPPLDRVGPELSSDATLATGGDNAIGSNSYNLRRAPVSYRYQSTDPLIRAFNRSQNNETYTESSPDWNNEFPASIVKAEAKYGKKHFSFHENRRATYQKLHPSAFGHESSLLTTLNGDNKQLMGVGLNTDHGYARSLARFAANLGPVVWKVASRKIECVLPTGLKFGPGWVEENEASPQPPAFLSEKQKSSNNSANDGHPNRPLAPSTSGFNSVATFRSPIPYKQEMVGGKESQNELAVLNSGAGGIRPEMAFQTRQKSVVQPDRNGINGVFGPVLASQMGMMRMVPPTRQYENSRLEETSVPHQMAGGIVSRSEGNLMTPIVSSSNLTEEPKFSGNIISGKSLASDSQKEPHHQHPRSSPSVPPDLNIRSQAPDSPSSSFLGSPHQPDLALQL